MLYEDIYNDAGIRLVAEKHAWRFLRAFGRKPPLFMFQKQIPNSIREDFEKIGCIFPRANRAAFGYPSLPCSMCGGARAMNLTAGQ